MASISYPCIQCGQRHDFEADLAGTWVFCESCEAAFQVPVPRHLANSPPKPGNVKFPCNFCNQRYEVSIDRVGRRFPCRKCGASLVVPGSIEPVIPAVTVVPPAPPPPSPPLMTRPSPPVAPTYSLPPPQYAAPVARSAAEAPRPQPATTSPAPLEFLDEPVNSLPKPGPRLDADDVLVPDTQFVLPRRVGPSRYKPGRSKSRGLAIGGGIGSILLTIVGVLVQVAVTSPWFRPNPFAANEAKYLGTLDAALAYMNGFGDVLASVHDAGGAMRAVPRVQEFIPKFLSYFQTLETYKGLVVSKNFEEDTKNAYMKKFEAAGNRVGRERERILALANTPNELRMAFGASMPPTVGGGMQFGMHSFQSRHSSRFSQPSTPGVNPPNPQPTMPGFNPPPPPRYQPPTLPSHMPHFRRHGRG